MHYYQFNIGDYKSHTEHLSEMEDLTYRRMLDWYYLHEKPFPADYGEIARLIRMRSHIDCIAVVLHEYFELAENGWIHHRANAEIAKAGDKSSKASESAKARWNRAKDANALPTQSESNATHNTLHITQDTEHNKKRRAVVQCPSDVDSQIWSDFVTLRKARKAPITQTSLTSIEREAKKAGWSLNRAIQECVTRGWQGFRADWVHTPTKVANAFPERNLAAARTIFGDERKMTNDPTIIESGPVKAIAR